MPHSENDPAASLDLEREAAFAQKLRWREGPSGALAQLTAGGRLRRLVHHIARVETPRPCKLPRPAGTTFGHAERLLCEWEFSSLEHLTRESLRTTAAGRRRPQVRNDVCAMLEAADDAASLPPRILAAWMSLLPLAARRLDWATFWKFWRRTLEEVRRYAASRAPTNDEPDDAFPELRDEILFRAGIVFSAVAESSDWLKAGRRGWRSRLETLSAGDWPTGNAADLLKWHGSLVRTTVDAAAYDMPLWKRRHRVRLQRLALRLAASLRPDGTWAGLGGSREEILPALSALLRLSGVDRDSPSAQLLKAVSRGRTRLSNKSMTGRGRTGRPGFQSDGSRYALLRNSWSPNANTCAVTWSGRRLDIEVAVHGEPFMAGEWTWPVRIAAAARTTPGSWKCDCWYSDKDVDLLEVSFDLGGGASLMRQVLLAREHSMLILAEALRGVAADEPASISTSLPLAGNLMAAEDGFTREIQVALSERPVRIFPLHLPWERSSRSNGAVRTGAGAVTAEVHGSGPVAQVLLFDWSSRTGDEPADGAALTIVEGNRALSVQEAVAGRVRVGRRHWFYLHNLTRGAIPRSVLGCHTGSETVVGRVEADGDVKLLVHIEASSEPPAEVPARSRRKKKHDRAAAAPC